MSGDFTFRFNPGRNLWLAIAASLLLHLLTAFILLRQHPLEPQLPAQAKNEALDVRLVLPGPPVPLPRHAEPHRQKATKIIALQKPQTAPTPKAVPMENPAATPPMSFQDYVNAARARRTGSVNATSKPAPEAMGPQQEVIRHPPGTSGIFQLIRMSGRQAEFSFLGWHSQFSNSHREVFEVDAGAGGDIQLAVARKMVEIIRRYYQENFNWDSQRLGRVVVLSARIQDSSELEAFMIKEFFSGE